MERTLVEDLATGYQRTINLLKDSIANFDDAQWRSGISHMQTPGHG